MLSRCAAAAHLQGKLFAASSSLRTCHCFVYFPLHSHSLKRNRAGDRRTASPSLFRFRTMATTTSNNTDLDLDSPPPPPPLPPPFSPVFGESGTTIFTTMSALSSKHDCINLGQGFPDVDGPRGIKEVAAKHLLEKPQQYCPATGVPELRGAIAEHSSKYCSLPVNADSGVVVTAGATEALSAAILAFVAPGDRVVLLDPSYDSYAPIVRAAGGEVVALPLIPPRATEAPEEASTSSSSSWSLPPPEDLEEAIGSKHTKLVVVNSPHNPTGKVFARHELELIASIVREKHPDGRCLLLLDEVYQHLVHPVGLPGKTSTAATGGGEREQREHVSLASLPGMAQRSVRVGSAGKTFSLTGFKIGWATSSNPVLTSALFRAHQFLTFCVSPALQAGVAAGFNDEEGYFLSLGAELAEKRARLEKWVAEAGFRPLPAEGTYFLVADAAALMLTEMGETDAEFCVRLAREGGVAAIPLSAFYANKSRAPRTLVRLCFCKNDEVLDEGGRRLKLFWEKQQQQK